MSNTISFTDTAARYAGKFNGVDDNVSVGNATSLRMTAELTFEWWQKFSILPSEAVAGAVRLWGKWGGTNDYALYATSSNVFVFGLYGGWGVASNAIVPDHEFHHYVITFSDAADKVVFYRDGIINKEVTATGTITATAANLTIVDGANYPFTGLVDNVRIYNYARTAKQILADYQGQPIADRTGLVGEWLFDEGTGTSVADSSGSSPANTGTWAGTGTHWDLVPPRIIGVQSITM